MLRALAMLLLSTPPEADPAQCVLKGTITVTREGKPIDASGLAVAYVKRVPQALWKVPHREHTVDQHGRRFSKRVVVAVAHDKLTLTNPDHEPHDAYSTDDQPWELNASASDKTGSKVLTDVGTYHVHCNLHETMRMDVLVVKNPFFSSVDDKGEYTLDPLPAGKYTVVAWEPNGAHAESEVTCGAGVTRVAPLTLEEAPEPKRKPKQGSLAPDQY